MAPVFTLQGHQVGHGAHRHQVQPVFRVNAFHRVFGQQGLGNLEGQAHAGQVFIRVFVAGLLGTHHRVSLGQVILGVVVVADDQVEAHLAGVLRLARGANAAIHADHHAHAVGIQGIQGIIVEAVTFIEAVGDLFAGVGAHPVQHLHQQGRAGDTVHIIIAVDRDGFVILQRAQQALHGGVHILNKNGSYSGPEAVRKVRACSALVMPRLKSR